jgi:hypothetical protein
MSSIITHKLRKAIAEAIYDDVFSRRNNYYYFFGRYLDSETIPSTPGNSLEYEQTVRNHILAAKKVYVSDIAYVVPRFDWVSGSSYVKYNTLLGGDINSSGPQFYVYDSVNYRVYKCINNNNGGASTVRPTSTDANDVTYADGYVWRYMYSLPKSIRSKFLTGAHLPVFTALQKRYYSDGGLGDITIVKAGNNYTQSTATITVSGDGSGAVIDPVIVNGQLGDIIVKNPGRDYTRAVLVIADSGAGTGAEAVVELNTGDLDSDQALVELLTVGGTVDTAEVLTGGEGYITASVKVIGDGTGAAAQAVIVGDSISRIIITNKGEGYSWASLVITPQFNPVITEAATTRVNVSPFLGHGRNAVDELFADQLMFYSNITSDRLADFDVATPYSQFGLIKNLRNLDYTSNIYDQVSPNRYQVEADFGPVVTFVGGGGTGAKGRVNVTGNYVSDIQIENGGEQYTSAPVISFGKLLPTLTVSRTTTTATATFAAETVVPYRIGASIVVAGTAVASGVGFNGTWTVTACTTSSVSWADTNGAGQTAITQGTVVTSGSGASAVATIDAKLNTVTLTNGGVGYASPPGISIVSTTGSKGIITATTSLGVGAITITNQGSGYATTPTISFTGGTGSGAAAEAVVSNGKVVKIIVTNPGSYTDIPTGVVFSTGTAAGTAVQTYTTSTLTISKIGSGYQTQPSLTFNGSCGISDIVVDDPGILFTSGSNPALTFTGGGGNGLAATAYVENCVRSIVISNAGSGYTVAPAVTFSGTGGAAATAIISGGKVVGITITNRGYGYTVAPTITIAPPTTGTQAVATAVVGLGITHVNVTNPGTGYTSVPTVSVANNGTRTGYKLTPVLGKATGSVTVTGYIKSVTLTGNGSGYTSAPAVVLTGGGGSSSNPAVLYSKVVGEVTSITIDEGGAGYSSRPSVIITGGEGIGASYVANISTATGKVTSCSKLKGGSNYVITKFADFTIGSLLIDNQLNEYNVHSAKTNLKNNSLIITSNNGYPVVGRMKIRKKNASDYFITNTALSQKFLESRFPVACYKVRGSFSLLDFTAGTTVTLTDSLNGNKTFIIISTQTFDTGINEMLILPIDGGALNNGVTLTNGVKSFSVVSYNEPALDRRTGEVLMISNNDSSFTQNSDQTLSFRTIINF